MAFNGKKYYPQEVQEIAEILRVFIDGHAAGLEILHGVAAFPSPDELTEMMVYLFGEGEAPDKALAVMEVIKKNGGLDHFTAVFNAEARGGSDDYRLFVQWTKGVKLGRPFKWAHCTTADLSRKYGLHPDTLRRRYNHYIMELAAEIKKRARQGKGLGQGERRPPESTCEGLVG